MDLGLDVYPELPDDPGWADLDVLNLASLSTSSSTGREKWPEYSRRTNGIWGVRLPEPDEPLDEGEVIVVGKETSEHLSIGSVASKAVVDSLMADHAEPMEPAIPEKDIIKRHPVTNDDGVETEWLVIRGGAGGNDAQA